ncbi:zinc finger protein basonuclin-2-like isoform X2 [Planococcus citri]|uniref:zinc finger protein basonuclin-2-like isoform X2 n=1 Tax=Planococcus citri TaxID=170843 RepID=UPI0031F91C1B
MLENAVKLSDATMKHYLEPFYSDNRVKDDWARGGGMNIPRMRRPEDQSATAGLMMEWASVASWFLKPEANNLLSTTCSSNSNVTNSTVSNNVKNSSNCRISSDLPLSFGPTICTAIRCTVPGCNCECFTPGKLHIRYCESCSHGWVPHALDKLGFQPIFGQTPVEPVQPNVAFDIASLVLYGCQALPIRLKILLDRLFSVLQKDEVTQILRGFGWSHEDYVRGYILQEAHGAVLDRWNICSQEEEPLVLQQFLRFGETRAITQQLLLHGLGDLRHVPRVEADFKKMVEKSISKGLTSSSSSSSKHHHHHHHEDGRSSSKSSSSQNTHHSSSSSSSANKIRNHQSSPPSNLSPSLLPPPPHLGGKYPLLPPPPPHPSSSPQHHHHHHRDQQHRDRGDHQQRGDQRDHRDHRDHHQPQPKHSSSLNFVKLPQTGLTCTPISSSNGPSSSPPSSTANAVANMSPLNKLQNMQPFDFRKIASGVFPSSTKPSMPPASVASSGSERRRPSEASSDTSQTGLNLCVTSPSPLLPPPPSSVSAASLSIPPTMGINSTYGSSGLAGCKSPATSDFLSKGSSEFGSEDGDDEEESSQSALNLSKDAAAAAAAAAAVAAGVHHRMPRQRHPHSRKTSTPIKRSWGSSNLPLNLGTQLINPQTGKKRVQCNVCLKTFCDKGALKIHFSAVHLREMHKCTVEGCNMMFSSRRSRNRHSANPNPKLHSPHLRRKISPHDGRSAQAHPILIPPLQAGLNPLTFGTFPLLTPPDLRHSLSGLDLKQGFEFGSMKDMKFEMSSDNQDDYMMDDDDEDGIVVDGAGVDDDENDSETNSGVDGKAGSTKSKRTKMSESDMDEDGVSNTDSNESITLSDHQPVKEENDLASKNVHKRKSQKPTRCTLRTVPSDDDMLSDDYSNEMIFGGANAAAAAAAVAAALAPKLDQEKEWDLSKSSVKVKPAEIVESRPSIDTEMTTDSTTFDDNNVKIENNSKHQSGDEEEFDEPEADDIEDATAGTECLNLSRKNSRKESGDVVIDASAVSESKETKKEPLSQDDTSCKSEREESPDHKSADTTIKRESPAPETDKSSRRSSSDSFIGKRKYCDEPDKNENYDREPLNFAMDTEDPSSPGRSPNHESSASTASCDSADENSENHVYGQYDEDDGAFLNSMDIPLDKDNPRKCTACGKVFQNHFGVKTHFQNVHLKLMHKCVIEGCNAAFPSKRSRDRHSNNSNLHRKLLSTTDSKTPPFLPDSPPFSGSGVGSNPGLHNDFLSRLYSDCGAPPVPPPPPTTTTNGDLLSAAHQSLLIPPLGALPFPGLNPFAAAAAAHLPVLNGKSGNGGAAGGDDSRHSPSKSPRLLVYNIEEDMPTPDQDNVFHCRFCSKPFTETVVLKDHYERNHLNEMYRCKVPGCFRVFSSRTKRNIHSENRLIHGKEMMTAS